MATIKQLIQSLRPDETFFSYEFFPPKTQSGMQNLVLRLERMAKLGSLFVTVTWGAGGSSAAKSLELASICQQELGLTTCLHLTCTNMDKTVLDDALAKAKDMGIRNILALRGDAARGQEYRAKSKNADDSDNDSNEFNYAVDLVRYIRQKYGDYFCIGVAAYPEGHVDGTDDSEQDPLKDLPYLVEKVQAGADFIITQLFYDCSKYLEFEQTLLNHSSGAFKDVTMIPGMMPINTYQSFLRAAKLSHATIPQSILDGIKSIPTGDDEAVKQFGVKVLSDMIRNIRVSPSSRTRGFHFYTLNLEKSVAQVLEQSGLLDKVEADESAIDETEGDVPHPVPSGRRRHSSLVAHNRVIVQDSEAQIAKKHPEEAVAEKQAGIKLGSPAPSDVLAISTGEGDLGREATWDDFPNGRFGDSRSPAYGEIDGYGPTLHVDVSRAYKLWGYPVDVKDLSELWSRHIRNELEVLPFSTQGLSPETALIQEELLEMIHRGYLTVASQPAANCLHSTDKIFGWGPPGGFVFQKAFVEFFVSPQKWKKIKPILDFSGPVFSYYEGNCNSSSKNFSTNLQHPGSSNAVTWGSFPNKEIVQSTIIEEESFLAWRDEAFAIWRKWRSLYKPGTASYKLLDEVCETWHLVSVVNHDYMNEQALWSLFRTL